MKKIFKVFIEFLLVYAMLFGLCGCTSKDNSSQYPRILYDHSASSPFRKIDIPDGHVLNDGHSYDIVDTEDGYDLVLHFVEVE
jgi:hypothetical protein